MTRLPGKFCLSLIALVGAMRGAPCAPVCEALTHATSFEMRMQPAEGETYTSKIFRGHGLDRTEIRDFATGPRAVRFQGNFVTSTPLRDGTDLSTFYSFPINKYIWDQSFRGGQMWGVLRGKKTETSEETFELLPDDKMTIEGCTYKIKHYILKIKSNPIEIVTEVWFSPELNVPLKYIVSSTSVSGRKNGTSSTAITIQPLQSGLR